MPTFSFRIETHTSKPIRLGGRELRVRSQVILLRLPVLYGGLIWNRPVAVIVRKAHGQEQILRVPDLTRLVVLILTGLSLASMFLLIVFRRRKIES